MDALEKILASHSFFSDISEEYLHTIVGCATNQRFKTKQVVLKAGDEANNFFLIRDGKVALEIPLHGRESITVQTIGSNEILGWSWLYPPYQWYFSARALEPTRVIAFDGVCLRGKCEADPRLGYEFLKRFSRIIIDRLSATRLQLLDLYNVHVPPQIVPEKGCE